ncbi:hypothetical protein ACFXMT_15150 [Streptomyces mirabilis]|uniref:hypothetical protein n=1 Tax=Streptomyces mirabilis TaxID=68239 RepID=UPI0036A83EF8
MGRRARIDEVLWFAQNRDPVIAVMDGHRNIHHGTASWSLTQSQLTKGINSIAEAAPPEGRRRR